MGDFAMDTIESIETIVSLIAGLTSVVMFFLAKREKDECVKIRNHIEQQIHINNKVSKIESNDEFNINSVDTFDNRKTIS